MKVNIEKKLLKDDLAIEIVPMGEKDLERVLEIENLSFPTPWSRRIFLATLEDQLSQGFIARSSEAGRDIILGFILYQQVLDEVHILNIAIHPEFRRKGLASEMLAFVLQRVIRLEAKDVYLDVRASNKAAKKLYKKFGFTPIGLRKGYYREVGEDAVVMWLPLHKE